MYFSVFESITKSIREACKWFFVTFLFTTKELRLEACEYFDNGRTSIRYFEWLSPDFLKTVYHDRWKAVMADYAAAYFKLILFTVLVNMSCMFLLSQKF